MEGQDVEQDESQEEEIQELLHKHEKVFQILPMQSLPEKIVEHIIEVKLGLNLVKVKPYRYPHHHKT